MFKFSLENKVITEQSISIKLTVIPITKDIGVFEKITTTVENNETSSLTVTGINYLNLLENAEEVEHDLNFVLDSKQLLKYSSKFGLPIMLTSIDDEDEIINDVLAEVYKDVNELDLILKNPDIVHELIYIDNIKAQISSIISGEIINTALDLKYYITNQERLESLSKEKINSLLNHLISSDQFHLFKSEALYNRDIDEIQGRITLSDKDWERIQDHISGRKLELNGASIKQIIDEFDVLGLKQFY